MKKILIVIVTLMLMSCAAFCLGSCKTNNPSTTDTDSTVSAEPSDTDSSVSAEPTVTVSFDTDGGSDVDSVTLKKGETLNDRPATGKVGFSFLGWYKDNECTDPYYVNEPINEDITLYAKYTELVDKMNFFEPTDTVIDVEKTYVVNLKTEKVIESDTINDFVKVEVIIGDDPKISLVKTSDGYKIVATEGYTEGGIYAIMLVDDEVFFEGQSESIRKLTLQIKKEKSDIMKIKSGIRNINYELVDNLVDGIPNTLDNNYIIISKTNYDKIIVDQGKKIEPGEVLCLTKGWTKAEVDADLTKIF